MNAQGYTRVPMSAQGYTRVPMSAHRRTRVPMSAQRLYKSVLTGCSSFSRMAKKRMKMRAVDLDMVYLGRRDMDSTRVEMGTVPYTS